MSRTTGATLGLVCGFALLTGCAQQPQSTAASDATFAVMSKLSDAASAERWKLVQLPDSSDRVAFVVDPFMQASILVGCKERNFLFISLALERRLTSDPKERAVVLLLDQGGFAAPNWIPRAETKDDDLTIFDIVYDKQYDYDFWPLIGNLKKHHSAVAVIKEGGKESSRYSFALIDASATIDAVLQHCGDAKPPQGPLLEQSALP